MSDATDLPNDATTPVGSSAFSHVAGLAGEAVNEILQGPLFDAETLHHAMEQVSDLMQHVQGDLLEAHADSSEFRSAPAFFARSNITSVGTPLSDDQKASAGLGRAAQLESFVVLASDQSKKRITLNPRISARKAGCQVWVL